MDTTIAICLSGVLVAAAAIDLRCRRIPNWLTFPAILAALTYHGVMGGTEGLLFGLKGLGLGFGLLLIPYALGVMGAGDVKLLAAAGAALGPLGVFWAFLFTCLAGGVYALIMLRGRFGILRKIVSDLWNSLGVFMATKRFHYAPPSTDGSLPRLCYGVAIAAGTMGFMAWTVAGPLLRGAV